MNCELIAVKIAHRSANVPELQKVLTEFGCCITMRIGLHETSSNSCSNEGTIILQVVDKHDELLSALSELEGVKAKIIEFD